MALMSGRRVLVTGAGRGIGAALAGHLAGQGACVVVNDIDLYTAESVAATIQEAGGTAVACGSNIATSDGAGAAVAVAVETWGGLDGLVNNAALFDIAEVVELDLARSQQLVTVNVLGSILCLHHAVKAMTDAGHGGAIVNICSGAFVGNPRMSVYSATKGAIASLTYSTARELEQTGIRVNAVCPRAATRMSEVARNYLAERGITGQRFAPALALRPENNAPLITYLLSDAAKSVNGQVIGIDGNRVMIFSHPNIVAERRHEHVWTETDLETLFSGPFADRLQPYGIEWP